MQVFAACVLVAAAMAFSGGSTRTLLQYARCAHNSCRECVEDEVCLWTISLDGGHACVQAGVPNPQEFHYIGKQCPAVEQSKCEGCTGRPLECWETCDGKGGFCSACDSLQGTKGACCKKDDLHDPAECNRISDYEYDGYHMCVLFHDLTVDCNLCSKDFACAGGCNVLFQHGEGYVPPGCHQCEEETKEICKNINTLDCSHYVEKPKCEGCTNRPQECWQPCYARGGFCSACDSVEGTKGACCKKGDIHDPEECHAVTEYEYEGYHQCVLVPEPHEIEQPKCEGCAGRPKECWETCEGKGGFCSACDSHQGTKGACCKKDDLHDPVECGLILEFQYDGYHQCVLVEYMRPSPGVP